jgi:hypothetical protein
MANDGTHDSSFPLSKSLENGVYQQNDWGPEAIPPKGEALLPSSPRMHSPSKSSRGQSPARRRLVTVSLFNCNGNRGNNDLNAQSSPVPDTFLLATVMQSQTISALVF